jgi:hypothetical protein
MSGQQDSLDTISLFDADNDSLGGRVPNAKLDVVKLNYDSAESVTWQELFEGFNTLHAITFSSGVNFIYRLLGMFDSAEIIFGCESVMSYTLQEIMAYQDKLIERLRDTASDAKSNLLTRIDKGSVRLYVSRTQLSHEKLYLLAADDGRKRVIMGSANMSYNAFGGVQRENICYIDGESAYDWYLNTFLELKKNSTDEIMRSALDKADLGENINELPIAGTIKANKVLVIEPVKENAEEVRFIMDTHKIAESLTPMLPKADKKTGKLTVVTDTITRLRRQLINETVKEKELRSEYPQLLIDVFHGAAFLNGEPLDLSPDSESVAEDVSLFLKYMDGYSKFHGDYIGMQYRYFEFANWFFCSPFMGVMRDMAARYDQNKLPYPVFGLVYGQSKAGKTSFLETLLKMMIGQKPKVSAPDFTRSSIENLKHTVQGAPIIVDDLTNTRFNQHAIETIKNDDFGVSEHLLNYSAVVISANEDVKAVAPEVIRRTVICRVEAGLTNTEVMKSNVVRSVQQKIGTAFYREYLKRMLDLIPDLLEILKADNDDNTPDILKCSSEVICTIFSEHVESLPDYIRPLSLENYFSEQVTGKYAIKTIQNAWKTSRKSFVVTARNNELRYNAGATYEADRLMKELPETLEAHKSRECVVMNLDEARHFFEINFKRPSPFGRLLR